MAQRPQLNPAERPIVEVVRSSYQPPKAELKEGLRVDVTFNEAVQALVQPVKVRNVDG